MRRLSLRTRLVLGVLALAAVALLAANAATYLSLRSFLLNQVDSSLEAGHVEVEQQELGQDRVAVGQADQPGGGRRSGAPGAPAQGIDWYEVRDLSGTVLASGFLVGGGSAPAVPAHISLPTQLDLANASHERVAYFTVASDNGSTSYRVRESIDPNRPSRVLLAAASLRNVFATLHRLLFIELLVTLAALAGIVGLGFWVVRLALRPLGAIEHTAATIASGDLTGRVERAEPRTEIGRLGCR